MYFERSIPEIKNEAKKLISIHTKFFFMSIEKMPIEKTT